MFSERYARGRATVKIVTSSQLGTWNLEPGTWNLELGTGTPRQTRSPHPAHVRADRAVVRLLEPRAEPEHRQALAHEDGAARAAGAGRRWADPRPVHWHR